MLISKGQYNVKLCMPLTFKAFSVTVLIVLVSLWAASSASAQCRTYTLDADFDQGLLVNVNHDDPNHDQLQLNTITTPFPFICIALSGRGTIVRVDVNTGEILGEYRSAPQGRSLNPSRTTVDLSGNVWTGNRDETSGGKGSVVKVGLVIGGTRGNKNPDGSFTPDPNGQYLQPPFQYSTAADRDGDGLIKTSRGLGNVLLWPDITDGAGGPDGIVEDAEDECILIYQRVNGDHSRHVSIDANNNVWTAGNFGSDNAFDLLDGNTGAILASFDVGAGGYGGLVDGNGVLWSTNRGPGPVTVLRYDTKGTITTADDTWSFLNSPNPYGLGIDGNSHIWNAQWTSNQIREFDPAGNLLNIYSTGGASNDRGVAVTLVDNHVWVANSGGSNVSRLANDGTLLKVISLGADGVTPTGVAVDANGKVWVTCYTSNTAKRIDPNAGGDGLGAVDLTVPLGAGANPYNYSDMTGIVAMSQTAPQGTWTIDYDGLAPGTNWGMVCWNTEPCSAQPTGSDITARARSSEDQVTWSAWEDVSNCVDLTVPDGRYLQVEMKLTPNDDGESPILCDVTICTGIQSVDIDIKPQSCPNPLNVVSSPDTWLTEDDLDVAAAKVGPGVPQRPKAVIPVAILGNDVDVYDIDPSTVELEGVSPVRFNYGDVATPVDDEAEECECTTLGPDGYMDMTLKFDRAAIIDSLGVVSDGDVIELTLTGQLYDGTDIEGTDCVIIRAGGGPPAIAEGGDAGVLGLNYPNPFNPTTEISFSLPTASHARLEIFNVMGQKVATLVDGRLEAGEHIIQWNGSNASSGVYFYRLQTDDFVGAKKMMLLK